MQIRKSASIDISYFSRRQPRLSSFAIQHSKESTCRVNRQFSVKLWRLGQKSQFLGSTITFFCRIQFIARSVAPAKNTDVANVVEIRDRCLWFQATDRLRGIAARSSFTTTTVLLTLNYRRSKRTGCPCRKRRYHVGIDKSWLTSFMQDILPQCRNFSFSYVQ